MFFGWWVLAVSVILDFGRSCEGGWDICLLLVLGGCLLFFSCLLLVG